MKELSPAVFEQWFASTLDVNSLQYVYEMAFYYGKVGLLIAVMVGILAGAMMLIFGCFG